MAHLCPAFPPYSGLNSLLTILWMSKRNTRFLDFQNFSSYNLSMEKVSPIEMRVKALVDAFLADKISRAEFKSELSMAKARLRLKKQRILPKAKGRTFS
jgi:hypothetical protein